VGFEGTTSASLYSGVIERANLAVNLKLPGGQRSLSLCHEQIGRMIKGRRINLNKIKNIVVVLKGFLAV
jgi:hypothetical protein